MDQQKIGIFMKELRKEKGVTQEQLADFLNTSRRTVSRWETGSNLPDIDILVILADYYSVDLREILNGERKQAEVDKEVKDTLLKAAEYENEKKTIFNRFINILSAMGVLAGILHIVMVFIESENRIFQFVYGATLGIMFGCTIIGFIMTGMNAAKFREAKLRILGLIRGDNHEKT